MQKYPAYKDSGLDWLGDVPTHWETTKAKWLFANISEKNCPDEQLLSATQEFGVVPRDMLEDRVVMPMGELGQFKLALQGDFVISLRSFQGGIEYSDYRGLVSPAYTVLRNKKPIDKTYFKYLMKCFPFISELQTSITGIREGKNINYKDFAEIIIPIPPISEQTKIASFIEEQTAVINQFLTNKRRLIELLEEQKQVVINTAVTQGLETAVARKPSGIDWLGEIPAHWQIKKFKYCAMIRGGQVDPRKEPYRSMLLIAPNHIEQGTGKLIYTETADEQGADSGKYLFESGDVLYSKIRPNLRKACLAPDSGLCSADMYAIVPKTILLPKFLLYMLVCDSFTQLTVVESMRVAMPKVNRDALNNTTIAYPTVKEQQAIVNFIEARLAEINTAIERTQREIELIEEYRTTLIAHAVTGKIDVRSVV